MRARIQLRMGPAFACYEIWQLRANEPESARLGRSSFALFADSSRGLPIYCRRGRFLTPARAGSGETSRVHSPGICGAQIHAVGNTTARLAFVCDVRGPAYPIDLPDVEKNLVSA